MLQIVAHDRAMRHTTSNRLESGARESRGCAGEKIRSAFRRVLVNRVGLERGRPCPPCSLQRRCDQHGHDALLAIAPPHIETRDRPDWHVVHACKHPCAIEPLQCTARRKLTPPYGYTAIESEQTGRWTAPHELSKRRLILLTGPLAIGTADSPVHAPTAIARAMLVKQVLQSRPQIGRERTDSELHAECPSDRSVVCGIGGPRRVELV